MCAEASSPRPPQGTGSATGSSSPAPPRFAPSTPTAEEPFPALSPTRLCPRADRAPRCLLAGGAAGPGRCGPSLPSAVPARGPRPGLTNPRRGSPPPHHRRAEKGVRIAQPYGRLQLWMGLVTSSRCPPPLPFATCTPGDGTLPEGLPPRLQGTGTP